VLYAGGREIFRATLEPTNRRGVYESGSDGGLLAFFSRQRPPNPLAGGELSWGRQGEDDGLVAYSFRLNDGAYLLDRMALTPADGQLQLLFSKRRHGHAPAELVARLSRQGG
jgi:hypothetical protein